MVFFKKNKVRFISHAVYQAKNSNWINYLNLKRDETTKVLEENMDEFLYNPRMREGPF